MANRKKQTIPVEDQAGAFLTWLFSGSEGTVLYRRITTSGSTKKFTTDATDVEWPVLDEGGNWYFGAVTRVPSDKSFKSLLYAPAVYIDIDGVDGVPELLEVAEPSAIVLTGHGVHAYWKLEKSIQPESLRDILKFAAVMLDGDLKSAEPARLLRIPGSMNVKYAPVVPCTLERMHEDLTYDSLDEIGDLLISVALASCYEEGQRNEVVMGFSAAMARAGVSETRCVKMVTRVIEFTGDKEKRTRLAAVQGTYDRHSKGEGVTPRGFAEAAGAKYSAVLRFLGAGLEGGEVMLGDETVGSEATVVQDMVALMVGSKCRWEWAEGQPLVWASDQWKPVDPKSVSYQVFKVMDQLTVSKAGATKKLPAKTGIAEGISKMVLGKLAESPMEPHEPELLGLKNGTLNLETGEFRTATKEDRMTKLMPVEYDERATAPNWERFLAEAVPNEAAFLQEFLGYCLRLGNPFERMLWLYGVSDTGKSTFLKTVSTMFGPLSVAVSSQNMTPYQIAGLAEAKIAVCTELATTKFRTGPFKSLVSADPISARHPYGRPFMLEFTGKFVWASNSLPNMDEWQGMVKRLGLIRFDVVPKVKDDQLKFKLKNELPGILNWAVEGLARLDSMIADGKKWVMPEASKELVGLYEVYQDYVSMFLEAKMDVGPGYEANLLEAYQHHTQFVRDLGGAWVSFGAWFPEELMRKGFKVEDGKIQGARLKTSNNLSWGFEKGNSKDGTND